MKTRVPRSPCLGCGKVWTGASSVGAEVKPSSGDITICIACGHLMAFAADLTLRELTDEEMHQVAGDSRILAVQKARAHVVRGKP